MRVAIMQPYFLPYIGYFQLINEADVFVVYDDVNFKKKGWINRNKILASGAEKVITLPIKKASQNKKINELYISEVPLKLLKTIEWEYRGSKGYAEAWPVLEKTLTDDEPHLVTFLERQLKRICTHLGISTRWVRASELDIAEGCKGRDRIISICKLLGGDHYINLSGGKHLYEQHYFNDRGLRLSFLSPPDFVYDQKLIGFHPNLSILDAMMSCSQQEVSQYVTKRSLE